MRQLVVILVMMLVSGVVSAEDPVQPIASDPRIEDALAAWTVWVENDLGVSGVPAASYSFVFRDELLASGGIGLADPATGAKADADTLYSICSISKLFTSIAVMRLRDAGELDLDEGIGDSVPWFASLTDAHPDDEPISIRRALTHSAGLPRESDSPYWAPDFDFPTTEQIRERLATQQTLYPSGRYFQYSNLGMSLLGEVIAAHAGRPWSEVIQEDILGPLGMDDTYTSVPEAHATGRLAAGFSARRGSPDRERLALFDVEGIGPAAGMASSANDLATFARWQLGLRADGGNQVLRAATLREMQRVHWVDPDWETTWGLGFSVVKRDDKTWVHRVRRPAQGGARDRGSDQRNPIEPLALCAQGGGGARPRGQGREQRFSGSAGTETRARPLRRGLRHGVGPQRHRSLEGRPGGGVAVEPGDRSRRLDCAAQARRRPCLSEGEDRRRQPRRGMGLRG